MPKRRPRLVLADGQPLLRGALRELLAPRYKVVAEVADGRVLVAAAERLRPDLVVADVALSGIDGIEAIRRLKAALPALRVLVLSARSKPAWVRAAFAAGACGYLTKAAAAEEVELAVDALLQGHYYLSPLVTRDVVASLLRDGGGPPAAAARESGRQGGAEPLTPRQLDVVQMVGNGLCNKEIARQLGVAVATVRTHLTRAHEKLGTESRIELALLAARTGRAVM